MKVLDSRTQISMKNILFATDFSEQSQAALPYAEAIARRYGSKVYVAYVIPPETYEFLPPVALNRAFKEIRAAAEQQMSALLKSDHLRGVPHEGLLGEGEVGEELRSAARQRRIDLLVLGTHGRGRFEKFMLGSVAEEIFRTVSCPVLTVGPGVAGQLPPRDGPRQILYATDFTPESLVAAPLALSLAQENQAHLILLHVEDAFGAYKQSARLKEERLRDLVPPEAELWCEPNSSSLLVPWPKPS